MQKRQVEGSKIMQKQEADHLAASVTVCNVN